MKRKLILLIFLAPSTLSLFAVYQSVYEGGQNSTYVQGNRLVQNSTGSQNTTTTSQNRALGQRTASNKLSLGRPVNR